MVVGVAMTDEQRAAIDESHRQFVIHLIMYNRRQMRDRRVLPPEQYHAQEFLQSNLCMMFVRLLGLGESMSDDEIAYCLISSQNEAIG